MKEEKESEDKIKKLEEEYQARIKCRFMDYACFTTYFLFFCCASVISICLTVYIVKRVWDLF